MLRITVLREKIMHRRDKKAYKILVGWPEGMRPLRRPKHKWEDNIRMDLKETG
jgi:hypothetical protein